MPVSTPDPFDVLVIGRSCVDYLYAVDAYPPEDHKVAATAHLVEGGGQGSTASCCIARLGGRVRYVGLVGDDEAGRFCLARLREYGVDTGDVRVVPGGRTPTAAIVVGPGGTRTIVYERPALPDLAVDGRLASLVAAAPVILLDPQVTYLAAELTALRRGLVVYDCERRRAGLDEMMALADYFIPSADFFMREEPRRGDEGLHERATAFRESLAGELVVTDGARGATWFADEATVTVSPPAVAVRDTTGSGDNFHAAFALGLARGLKRDELLALAVAVATLSCRELGGRRGIPAWDEARAAAAKAGVLRGPGPGSRAARRGRTAPGGEG